MAYGMGDVTGLFRLLDNGELTDRQRHIERQKIEALLGYCETVACRRQVLLGYFGEAGHPPCGNCDNCRTPVASWDGTIAAQKALSAVYRTGQRFGTRHLVDLLLGAETERIRKLGHHKLKTFGVGKELDRRVWLSVFRQLVAQGVVLPDVAGYGGLSLGPGAAEILRGVKTVRFRQDSRSLKTRRDQKAAGNVPELEPAARGLWDALRAWRLDEARRQELPPYVIFHDSTLIELARRRPVSLAALALIPGIGRSKLERYGSAVIEIVAADRSDRSHPAEPAVRAASPDAGGRAGN
jgi:ATP-dependent DNA helicase RecQ